MTPPRVLIYLPGPLDPPQLRQRFADDVRAALRAATAQDGDQVHLGLDVLAASLSDPALGGQGLMVEIGHQPRVTALGPVDAPRASLTLRDRVPQGHQLPV